MTDGEKLKQRLKELGMSNAEFARRYGCSSQNVYILFKSNEIRGKNKEKIESILSFKFDTQKGKYEKMYFKILKEYNEILKENRKLREENSMLKKMLL